jgi:hypothetical protein
MATGNEYQYKLRFTIDGDAHPDYMSRWAAVKHTFEIERDCEELRYFVSNTLIHCKLEQNRNLPCLDRAEGGIGGNDNRTNKQIRFHGATHGGLPRNAPGIRDILFDRVYNTTTESWTHEELFDLIQAFEESFNHLVEVECVNGHIEVECANGHIEIYKD